jgi:hypothetical protein
MCYIMTDPIVKYGTIGNYSGPTIGGTVEAFTKLPTMMNSHLDRAFWLTTMVESGGKAGSIMAADGTGMTASLEQLVAVYPRNMNEQGSLFGILRKLSEIVNLDEFLSFDKMGWELFEGVLRDKKTARAILPQVIQDTFTPPNGHVPVKGPQWEQSKSWALEFHKLFAHPTTLGTQIKYGMDQFVKFSRTKSPRLRKQSVETLVYYGDIERDDPFVDDVINDLAMSVWWSYKVNGPTPALERLFDAVTDHKPDSSEFGRHLINLLRTSQYGRWATNRYDRTRQNAMKVWPPEFFDGPDSVMPARR